MASPPPKPPALNHYFFTGIFLTLLCFAAALGAILSNDFASGAAMVNGSEGYAPVKMGLWYGTSTIADRHEVFYYQWCQSKSPAYHAAHCLSLSVARATACVGVGFLVALLVLLILLLSFSVKMRLEPRLARVSAALSSCAALCFVVCVGLWAQLILTLSAKGENNKAQLSIGISWLTEGGACVLAVLITVNLLQVARRIDAEFVAMARAVQVQEQGQGKEVEMEGQQVTGGGQLGRTARKHQPSHGSVGGGVVAGDLIA